MATTIHPPVAGGRDDGLGGTDQNEQGDDGHLTRRAGALPLFGGKTNVVRWVAAYELFAEEAHWRESTWILRAFNCLRGEALKWAENRHLYKEADWTIFKDAITKRFGPQLQDYDALTKMNGMARKRYEGIREFANRLEDVANTAEHFSESHLKRTLIRGLTRDMRYPLYAQAQHQQDVTFDDLVRAAEQLENLGIGDGDKDRQLGMSAPTTPMRTGSVTSTSTGKSWTPTCFKCNQLGHLANKCPTLKKPVISIPSPGPWTRSKGSPAADPSRSILTLTDEDMENQVISADEFLAIADRECFACKNKSHLMRDCPLWKAFKAKYFQTRGLKEKKETLTVFREAMVDPPLLEEFPEGEIDCECEEDAEVE